MMKTNDDKVSYNNNNTNNNDNNNNNIQNGKEVEVDDVGNRKNLGNTSRIVCNMNSQRCQDYLQQILKIEKLNETVELTNEEAAQLTNEALRQRLLARVANDNATIYNVNGNKSAQPEYFYNPEEDSSSSSHDSSSSEEEQEEGDDSDQEEFNDDPNNNLNLNIIPEEDSQTSKSKKTKKKKYVKKTKADRKMDETMKSLGTPPYRIYDIPNQDETSNTNEFKKEFHVPAVWNGNFPFSNGSTAKMNGSSSSKKVGILLCRSGKFAISIFELSNSNSNSNNNTNNHSGSSNNIADCCLDHRTASRYTIRKGQGKSQSAADGGKNIKSIGSQLRRAGEVSLQKDISTILQDLQHLLEDTHTLFLNCPNVSLYHQTILPNLPSSLLADNNRRIKRIPLSIKRPTHLATRAVYQILTNCLLITKPILTVNTDTPTTSIEDEKKEDGVCKDKNDNSESNSGNDSKSKKKVEHVDIPLSLMHEAARDGNLEALSSMLDSHKEEVNFKAGPYLWTPLHYASAGNHSSCISKLLCNGLADPSVVDIRSRPPVFLCTTETSRNSYRIARFELSSSSEEHSSIVWTGVGPPISTEQLEDAKLIKKQKLKAKKQKQKQNAAKKKKEQEAAVAALKEEQEATAASRVTTLLQRLCDFCNSPYKKKNEFTKLEYKYCSIECVKKHQRQLMADAALARYGN